MMALLIDFGLVGISFFWLHLVFRVILSQKRFPLIDDVEPTSLDFPLISVIMPCKDEETSVSQSIEKLFQSDYPHLEVIAINDRSKDLTGERLDQAKSNYQDRLTVVHNETLPPGVLGKVHALQLGLTNAKGEYVLLMDGDVFLQKETLKKSIFAAKSKNLDHLSILPHLITDTALEKAMNATFFVLLSIALNLYEANHPKKKTAMGAGAFTLLRTSFLKKHNLLDKVKLEVIEDVALAYLTKQLGGRSFVYDTREQVKVRFQQGITGLIKGTEKNTFSGIHYSYAMLLVSSLGLILLAVLPFFALLNGLTGAFLFCLILVMQMIVFQKTLTWTPFYGAIVFPAGAILMVISLWRSAIAFFKNKGIVWRETFYSATDLKKGKVLPPPWHFLGKSKIR